MGTEFERIWFDSIAWDIYTVLSPIVMQSVTLIAIALLSGVLRAPKRKISQLFSNGLVKWVSLVQFVVIALAIAGLFYSYDWNFHPAAAQRLRLAFDPESGLALWGLASVGLLFSAMLSYHALANESSLVLFKVARGWLASVAIGSACLMVLIALANVLPELQNARLNMVSVGSGPFYSHYGYIFLLVGLTAVSEELFFRGVLLRYLAQALDVRIAIFLSALAFAAYHVDLAAFPWLLLGGVALGIAFVTSGRLSVVIGVHILFSAGIWVGSSLLSAGS